MIIEETLTKLTQMKMHAMAKSAHDRLSRPDHQDLSHQEMLGLIVDDEWLSRENRKMSARLRSARFKIPATLEGIGYQTKRGLVKAKILDLGNLQWISHKRNVIFTGPTGSGKSYIAQALAHQACRRGFAAHYIRMSRLMDDLELSRGDGSYRRYLAKLLKFDVLVIDDWGIAGLTEQGRQDLLEVIEERYEIRSLILTTQKPIKNWHAFIGDDTIADAICDRLVHNAYKIELKQGEDSMRKHKGGISEE